ncbi:MAG: hypothetical protein KIT84_12290 [Labilithrix sp.]|nr:hypothetical protein [Labilithrix sp.]MCW5811792.1 hypothetical protein [Labilithrix sp.]
MTTRVRSFFFGVVATTSAIVACSGGGGTSGGGGATTSSFATEYCDILGGTCCPKQGKTYNGGTCRALLALGGASEDVAFDAARADACLAALRSAQSAPTFCEDLGGKAVDDTCDGVYTRTGSGTKQPGAVCESDAECAPDPSGDVECVFSSSSDGGTSRTCVVYVRAKENDTCLGDKATSPFDGTSTSTTASGDGPRREVCWEADGLYCSYGRGGEPRVCKKRSAIGEACEGYGQNSCVAGALCGSGATCVAFGEVGEDCAATGACVRGAFCDPNTQKCGVTIPPGGACTRNVECGTFGSCTNGKCEGGSLGVGLFFCSQ